MVRDTREQARGEHHDGGAYPPAPLDGNGEC